MSTLTLPTFDELYAAAKAEVLARNAQLTDWTAGSALDAVTGSAALLADQVLAVVVASFAQHFVDTATGEALDALAADRVGLTRLPATPSRGRVRWTKGSEGITYVIPAGTVLSGEYRGRRVAVETVGDTSIAAADEYVDLECQATTEGVATNFPADVLTEIDTYFVDDLLAEVTNPYRFVGGSAQESDAEFRDRIRGYYRTLRRGTVEALKAGARSVPGVRHVAVSEADASTAAGLVRVYAGDPDARSNQVLADLVQAELVNWRAAGVQVLVTGAERQEVTLLLELTVRQGADRSAIGTAVRAAVVAYAATLAPGETLAGSRVAQLAHNASPLVVAVAPVADVEAAERHHAVRVRPEGVEFGWTEVP